MGQSYEPTRPNAGPHEQIPTALPTSTTPRIETAEQIAAARGGSQTALGELFEQCRNYLLLIANSAVGKGLRGRVAASDVVQETFLEAGQVFGRFQGDTEAHLLRWLTDILEKKLGNTFKGQPWPAKRDPSGEARFNGGDNAESCDRRLADSHAAHRGAACSIEESLHVQKAISNLSEEHQAVINLRIYEGLPFDQVGQAMNRTDEAARNLFIRAIDELRVQFKSHDPSAN